MFAILALLIFASLTLAGYALAAMARARETAKQALDRRLWTMAGSGDGTLHVGVLKDRRLSSIGFVNRVLPRLKIVVPLGRLIARAGLKKRVGEVLLLMVFLALAATFVCALVTGNVLFSVVAGAIAGAVPVVIVRRMARKRSLLFAEQLPDALDLARSALQAGHGLMAALSVVADEFPDPISQEFRELTEEVRLGLSMREALDDLADRVGTPDLALLQVGVLVAQDIGGNLTEVFDNISHTIRERFKVQRETKVLTAQGRISGGVLTALPFLVGIGLTLINPSYMKPMFETTTGHHMLMYAGGSMLLGHLIIRRLVAIKV
jgi:tight adherence protein B